MEKKAIINKRMIALIAQILIMGIGLLVMIVRVHYGVELTDESWYMSEPYVISRGAIPYVDSWSQAPGFTFPLFYIVKLFLALNKSTEGIVIFFRIFFVCWSFCIIFLSFGLYAIKRYNKNVFVLFLALIIFAPHQLFSVNYNTIGLWYVLLACFLLMDESASKKIYNIYIRGLFAGVVIARAIIGTPAVILPCIVLLAMLMVKKEYTKMIGYISGGGLMAIFVVAYCGIKGGGINNILKGLINIMQDSPYLYIQSVSLMWKIKGILVFLAPSIACLAIVMGFDFLFKKDENKKNIIKYLLLLFLIMGLIVGIIANDLGLFVSFSWFEGLFLCFFDDRKKFGEFRIFAEITVIYFFYYLSSVFTNVYGPAAREYILYFSSIFSFVVICQIISTFSKKNPFPIILILCVCFFSMEYCFTHVYRDESISNMAFKVEKGIWKGCYTTKERADKVVWLENTIRGITEKTDKVLFLDWASFAYLMSNGNAFTPTTLDPQGYHQRVNRPELIQDYFEIKQDIPDKIIYIEYGYEKSLSIENESWRFNEFVHANYVFKTSKCMDEYRVLLYEKIRN